MFLRATWRCQLIALARLRGVQFYDIIKMCDPRKGRFDSWTYQQTFPLNMHETDIYGYLY